MPYCGSCKGEVLATDLVCGNCGARLRAERDAETTGTPKSEKSGWGCAFDAGLALVVIVGGSGVAGMVLVSVLLRIFAIGAALFVGGLIVREIARMLRR